jgi:hypothetical protein
MAKSDLTVIHTLTMDDAEFQLIHQLLNIASKEGPNAPQAAKLRDDLLEASHKYLQ